MGRPLMAGRVAGARVPFPHPGYRMFPSSGKARPLDTSDWLLVVASVVLGQFALLGIEWLRGQIDRRQRREDRRDDFQRRTLLDLQDALDTLLGLTCEMYLHRQRSTKVSDELAEAHRKAASQVNILLTRCPDPKFQEHVEAFKNYAQRVLYAPDVDYGAGTAFKYMGEPFDSAIRRTGELLSGL